MVKKTKTRITSISIRENSKKDHSPRWDDAENWSGEKFTSHFREAMAYYNLNNSSRDLKPKIIDWMSRSGYTKDQIQKFKNTADWRCGLTLGSVTANLLKGMPSKHPGFNKGKNTEDWVREQISQIIEEGSKDNKEESKDQKVRIEAPVVSVQDRIREQAVTMSDEIDSAIDNFISDPDNFDPKAFKITNLLKGKGAKAAHARIIKGFYEKDYNELIYLSSGKADEQVREAHKHLPRKNVKKIIEFHELIRSSCDQIAAESKVLRKVRAKKVKPAEELIKKLKFKLSEPKLKITSVPPASIIGAQTVVVYNVITRKIGIYHAKTSNGLSVKGASITEFTDKSTQKTLRKPEEQIAEFKEQNTAKRIETWFNNNVKTIETNLNGRLNEDTIILRIFK